MTWRGSVGEGVATDQVQHGVDRSAEAGELLADRPGSVVEHGGGAERADQVVVAGGGGADHLGAQGGGDLDRHLADSARGGVDQHPVARGHLQRLGQGLPRGQPGERDAGSLLEGQPGGLAGDGALGGGHQLGRRAVGDVVAAYVAPHLVALLHAGDDGGADLLDDAGDVPPGGDREVVGVALLQEALADLPVDRVDAGGPHPDQHDVGSDDRVGTLTHRQHLGSAVALEHRCTHCCSSWGRAVCGLPGQHGSGRTIPLAGRRWPVAGWPAWPPVLPTSASTPPTPTPRRSGGRRCSTTSSSTTTTRKARAPAWRSGA